MPIAALINMTAENNPITICIDPSHLVARNAKYIALWSLEKYDWTKVEKMSFLFFVALLKFKTDTRTA